MDSDALTLDQLRVFLCVAEQGTFSGAARHLGRAQSAVSYAIANLEALLEVELFDRSTRTPTLTAAGAALVADARAVSARVADLRARARGLRGGLEPEVAIALDTLLPLEPLLIVLGEFQREFPTVALQLRSEALGAVAEVVGRGDADIGISGPIRADAVGLEQHPLTDVMMVCAVSPEHPLASQPAPVSSQLLHESVRIELADRSGSARSDARGRGTAWRVADIATQLTLVESGFGWGWLPEHCARESFAAGRLVKLVSEEERAGAHRAEPLCFVTRVADPPGPAGHWLIARISARLGAEPPDSAVRGAELAESVRGDAAPPASDVPRSRLRARGRRTKSG